MRTVVSSLGFSPGSSGAASNHLLRLSVQTFGVQAAALSDAAHSSATDAMRCQDSEYHSAATTATTSLESHECGSRAYSTALVDSIYKHCTPMRRQDAAALHAVRGLCSRSGNAAITLLPYHSSRAFASAPQRAAQEEAASSQQPSEGPLALFESRRSQGLYRTDPRQVAVVNILQGLYDELSQLYPKTRRPSGLTMVDSVSTSSVTSWWSAITEATQPHLGHAQEGQNPNRPRGLYMWGGVGVGKTMLMDIFAESAPREFKLKRIHFHDFMLDVHSRLRQFAQEQDPLVRVADSISTSVNVLCLDELFVNDVADAMILGRLFERLWDRGITLIATSNRRPDKLYEGGLQRQLFLPFIHRLERECVVHDMDSVTDYRQLATKTVGVYFVRLREGFTNDDRLEHTFDKVTESAPEVATHVDVAMGRRLQVPRAVGRACLFTFQELCGEAVGASDYIALVEKFHTIALKGVPVFRANNRTLAYRFVALIDVMYDHRTKLLVSAEDYSPALFKNVVTYADSKGREKEEELVVDDNLGFAKDRTVSRLNEMQSMEYAIAHAERHAPELLLALQEAQARRP